LIAGRGAATASDAQGISTQSHISRSTLKYEDETRTCKTPRGVPPATGPVAGVNGSGVRERERERVARERGDTEASERQEAPPALCAPRPPRSEFPAPEKILCLVTPRQDVFVALLCGDGLGERGERRAPPPSNAPSSGAHTPARAPPTRGSSPEAQPPASPRTRPRAPSWQLSPRPPRARARAPRRQLSSRPRPYPRPLYWTRPPSPAGRL